MQGMSSSAGVILCMMGRQRWGREADGHAGSLDTRHRGIEVCLWIHPSKLKSKWLHERKSAVEGRKNKKKMQSSLERKVRIKRL